jgi:NTE family protein
MRIGVALSGGGFRAALFHLGVLRRVAELGWLPKIDAISGVSGGSIVAAFAALRWAEMLTKGGDAEAFQKYIAGPFINVVTTRSFIREWLVRAAGQGVRRALDPTYSRTTALGDVLSERLYQQGTCADLPAIPYTILNATSLISVRAWRFTRDGLGDSRIGYSGWSPAHHSLSIGLAVAASAAFPPVFAPVRIDASQYTFSGTQYRDEPVATPVTIALTDGGVYENLGTEVLTKRTPLPGGRVLEEPEFLLVSDGGYPPPYQFDPSRLPGVASLALMLRVNTIALEQVSALRRRRLTWMFERRQPSGLLVALGSNVDRLPPGEAERYRELVGGATCPPAEVVDRIRRVRTHLNRFSLDEAEVLMYHGYLLTDAFLWARSADLPPAYRRSDRPPAWQLTFGSDVVERTRAALRTSHRLW